MCGVEVVDNGHSAARRELKNYSGAAGSTCGRGPIEVAVHALDKAAIGSGPVDSVEVINRADLGLDDFEDCSDAPCSTLFGHPVKRTVCALNKWSIGS